MQILMSLDIPEEAYKLKLEGVAEADKEIRILEYNFDKSELSRLRKLWNFFKNVCDNFEVAP